MRTHIAAALLVGATGLAALPAQAAKPQEVIYPATAVAGTWSSMGMPAVIMTANRAAGPASRLLIHLPENLQKTGQADFSLSRASGNTWVDKEPHVTLSFSLVSENFGVLKMVGEKPDHHFELPISRY